MVLESITYGQALQMYPDHKIVIVVNMGYAIEPIHNDQYEDYLFHDDTADHVQVDGDTLTLIYL